MKKIKVKKFNFVLISTLLILWLDVWSVDDAGQIERRLDQIEKLLRTDGLLNLSSDVDKLKEDQRSLQGRIEEITMKEDIITNNFIGDDGFGDIMFEGELETEMFRHQASIEEPLNKTNDISKLSTIDEPKAITDSTLERSRIGIVLCV